VTRRDRPRTRDEADSSARTLERLTLIAQITNPVVGAGPLRVQVSSLLEQVCSAYGVDASVVRTLEGSDLELLAAVGIPICQLCGRLPADVGIARELIHERKPLAIENVETKSTTALLASDARRDATKYWFRSYAGAPLLVENRAVGVLGIYSTQGERRFTESELNHLQIVANHIAISIINDRLYRELIENRSELQRQIRERERAEKNRRAMEEQLRHSQRMEALGQLAGGVAHDFNNLLTVILGGTEFLLNDAGPTHSPASIDWITRIDEAARRACNLARQLLAFSRKQPNNPTVFDLSHLVRDLEGILRRLIREDIELSLCCEERPCTIRADAGQLEQVIINLVVNARDAIPGRGQIEIACMRAPCGSHGTLAENLASDQEHALLAVRDSGVGMDFPTMQHIFEPFFTTKAPGAGTGLGLSTAYGIVKQAGGDISVESASGHGSTFRVFLPIHAPIETFSVRADAGRGPLRGTETVLVCEDEALVRQVICKTLSSAGYKILEAHDGDAAVELARANAGAVDLLITDMVMPGMNGRELASRLHEAIPGLPCVIVSGYLGDVTDCGSAPRPWEHVLPKPFGPRALLECVRDVLSKTSASS
ncbi:MAG: response regulator, partial [Phycisphaerae bacterium]|nr:response regulator [Phycisphaerae bacterium]